ncbi:hypothetical protein Tco_0247521 [Tanacetum coccineum]
MWAADCVFALTPGSAITIPKTTNEFAIKGNHLTLVKGNQFDGRINTDLHKHIHEFLGICDMFKYRDTKNEAVRLMMFPLSLTREAKTWMGSSNSDTDKIMARIDAMTMKMDAQYKEFQSRLKQLNPDHNDDDIPMSHEEEAKFMQTFRRTHFYNDYRDRDSNCDNWRSSERNDYNRDNYQSNSDDKPDLQKQLSDFIKAQHSTNYFVKDTFMDLKTKLETTTQNHQTSIQNLKAKFEKFANKQSGRPSRSLPIKQKQLNLGVGSEGMIFNIDSSMKHSYSNDDTCFSIDVIEKILEEDFDALLDKGSEILYSIKGTILEEKLFAEFDKFMAMTTDEKSESKPKTEEPPFEKITFNTDYKIKTSLKEPPMDLELKPLPDNIKYVFLEEPSFLSVIISSQLSKQNKNKLVSVLKRHKQAFAWKTTYVPGICPSFCKHNI